MKQKQIKLSGKEGFENYYQELMLNSASPSARRSHSQLLTGDPFKFNIDLDTDAIYQPADVCAAYLKTLGVRIRHIKIRKFINRPIIRSVVERVPLVKRNLVYVIPKDVRDKGRDEAQKYLDKLVEEDKKHSEKGTIQVVSIIPGVYEQTKAEEAYREKSFILYFSTINCFSIFHLVIAPVITKINCISC